MTDGQPPSILHEALMMKVVYSCVDEILSQRILKLNYTIRWCIKRRFILTKIINMMMMMMMVLIPTTAKFEYYDFCLFIFKLIFFR